MKPPRVLYTVETHLRGTRRPWDISDGAVFVTKNEAQCEAVWFHHHAPDQETRIVRYDRRKP